MRFVSLGSFRSAPERMLSMFLARRRLQIVEKAHLQHVQGTQFTKGVMSLRITMLKLEGSQIYRSLAWFKSAENTKQIKERTFSKQKLRITIKTKERCAVVDVRSVHGTLLSQQQYTIIHMHKINMNVHKNDTYL